MNVESYRMTSNSQPDWKALFGRVFMIFAAFFVAYIIYWIAMVMTTYDGMISLIVQPFMAALVSAVFVTAAFLLGLFLKLPSIRTFWYSRRRWAIIVSLIGLSLLCFGYSLGIRSIGTNPDNGTQFEMLDPYVAVISYFMVVFGVVNMPVRILTKKVTGTEH